MGQVVVPAPDGGRENAVVVEICSTGKALIVRLLPSSSGPSWKLLVIDHHTFLSLLLQ